MNLNRIFTEQNLHNISAIIADTSRGLTKSELERHLRESKITLVSDGSFNNGLYYKIGLNKRDWLYNCLANEINSTHNPKVVGSSPTPATNEMPLLKQFTEDFLFF